ncbi:unnamed protein product [Pleuronectes platessa]|uniref:Uncharacterized protein n=1 Tax=Pleuronectes platessa TaxID=8262 RepID=A0A9N7TKI8_PLEPL|nr:unnamed protein product [Pleuronectes platessa]
MPPPPVCTASQDLPLQHVDVDRARCAEMEEAAETASRVQSEAPETAEQDTKPSNVPSGYEEISICSPRSALETGATRLTATSGGRPASGGVVCVCGIVWEWRGRGDGDTGGFATHHTCQLAAPGTRVEPCQSPANATGLMVVAEVLAAVQVGNMNHPAGMKCSAWKAAVSTARMDEGRQERDETDSSSQPSSIHSSIHPSLSLPSPSLPPSLPLFYAPAQRYPALDLITNISLTSLSESSTCVCDSGAIS